ncbi:MAG TPA: hypothetical protein VJ812_05925 [Gemmatimonadaceae bacterium]|jgi:hypothetical protein|nr:hypothetical protein [Gemmatimonadaceae bacterium]
MSCTALMRENREGLMSDIRRVDDLDIDQDLEFQRREWKVQRIAWALMLLAILAALAGIFGRGVLARAVAGRTGDPLRVEHDRFVRRHSDETLTLVLSPEAVRAGEARIHVDSALIGALDIRRLTPEPERQEATPDGIVATFRLGESGAPHRILVDYQADAYWSASGAIALERHTPVRLHFVVYP